MENKRIRKYFHNKTENTQKILIRILEDGFLCLHDGKIIEDKVLNRIISVYFLLIDYEYKQMIEFENLEPREKKILYKIIMDGIVAIYVDNEYLEYSDRGTKYKQWIIQELLSFFKYITKFNNDKVFAIYAKEVKKYRLRGFSWDNIPY